MVMIIVGKNMQTVALNAKVQTGELTVAPFTHLRFTMKKPPSNSITTTMYVKKMRSKKENECSQYFQ